MENGNPMLLAVLRAEHASRTPNACTFGISGIQVTRIMPISRGDNYLAMAGNEPCPLG